MTVRSGSAKELERFGKRATPVFAFFAAVAGLVALVGGPTWALIVLAAIAVVGPVVDWVLKGRQRTAEVRELREALWVTRPARVRELAAGDAFYRLGVETEAREALEAAGQAANGHAAYVERDVDELELRSALRAAGDKAEPSLVVLRGPSKAGKSRTLLEAAAHVLPDLWLIQPKDAAALGTLARGRPPPEIADEPCVIWLDDVEMFVGPADLGLNRHTLAAFEDWKRPVVVLATAGGKRRMPAGGDGQLLADSISDALAAASQTIRLSSRLSPSEQHRLGDDYSPEAARRIADDGIGEYMIVAQRLVERLEEDRECPEGIAVARAAIDWRRAGLVRPVPAGCLQRLFPAYLNGPATRERFDRGLEWATTPLYSHVALLLGNDPYEPYDFLVDRAEGEATVLASTWDMIVEEYATDDELTNIGVSAFDGGDPERAEAALRRADERGHTLGAFNLGVVLERRGDDAGAEAAYRRADERGGGDGAVNLGALLARRGDEAGAEDAHRRADERGEANGAFNLGLLLESRGDMAGAEAAYRRADERGNANGSVSLGVLLAQRGDEAGEEAAYRRADERGNANGAFNLGVLLAKRGDAAGEEAAFRRADERGDANGAFNVGVLLAKQGDEAGAEAAYRRADERGQAQGGINLGKLLAERGDEAGAEAAYRRVDERGGGDGAVSLGVLLARRGDEAGAEAAFRRADERGEANGAFSLGVLLARRGDEAGAEVAYRRADELGHADGAFQLGVLLELHGDEAGAESACRRAGERDGGDGAVNLGMLLERRGDEAGAEAAYRRADERGEADGAFNLARLLAQRGDEAGAEAAYRRAAGSADPDVAAAALSALAWLQGRRG